MKKLIPAILLLLILVLPCISLASTLGGTVWLDKKLDGVMDGERGLADAQIALLDENGYTLGETKSAKDGTYLFEELGDGVYTLSVKLPSAYVPTIFGLDSQLLPAQGNQSYTQEIYVSGDTTVNLGTTKTTVFFGFVAFIDANQNGGRMKTEETVRGIHVDVVSDVTGEEVIIASGETDREGALNIRELSPGTYKIAVTLPENYIIGPLGTKLNTWYNCINPSESSIAYSDPIELNSGSIGLGIGMVRTGAAKGSIWYDENGDGIRNPDESAFDGALIELVNDEFDLTRTTKADENGNFAFELLQPSTYRLRVTLPEGYMFAASGDSVLKYGYSATDECNVIVVEGSTTNMGAVGVIDASSLSVSVTDENGLPAGAEVIVFADQKQVLRGSAEDGLAYFPVVREGNVTVQCVLENGKVFSPDESGNDFAQYMAKSDLSVDAVIIADEDTLLNAVVTDPAGISGCVFADEDNNGVRADSEYGMAGFTVLAIAENEEIAAQTVSDENGAYTLFPLTPGSYTVRILLNDPYIASEPGENNAVASRNSEAGETAVLVCTAGMERVNIDLGVFKAGTAQSYVTITRDGLTTTEGGMSDVLVTLMNEDGTAFSEYTVVTTDENGFFYLKGILPGTYTVHYALPENALLDAADETEYDSEAFVSGMGTETELPVLGAVKTATVSGTVCHLGEPVSAKITLTNENGDEYAASAAENGSFTIAYLRPNTYTVEIELTEDLSFGYGTALVEATEENISLGEITLDIGEEKLNQQVIAAKLGSVSGIIYDDENNSGEREGDETLTEGFELNVLDSDKQLLYTVSSDENGAFETQMMLPGAYYLSAELPGDTLLVHKDAEQDGNTWYIPFTIQDSQQLEGLEVGRMVLAAIDGQMWSLDGSTDGLSGIEVALYLASESNSAVALRTTDENGRFAFEGLYPDEYFVKAQLPENHLFARSKDTGTQDSLILGDTDEGKNGCSEVFYLGIGETLNAAIGIGAKGAIGDFAWLDENGNGMQDLGESGIPGIKIEMYQYGELVAETETNEYGHYFIDYLYPGTYTMKVTMHAELKPTKQQTEFKLVRSIMPESNETVVEVQDVTVPSGGRDLSLDLGFVLCKKGVYPSVMDDIPTTDWSWGGKKNN